MHREFRQIAGLDIKGHLCDLPKKIQRHTEKKQDGDTGEYFGHRVILRWDAGTFEPVFQVSKGLEVGLVWKLCNASRYNATADPYPGAGESLTSKRSLRVDYKYSGNNVLQFVTAHFWNGNREPGHIHGPSRAFARDVCQSLLAFITSTRKQNVIKN